MKIFITGVNGFIGSHLARHFAAKRWETQGSGRSAGAVVFRFGDPVPDGLFRGVDAIVHSAHDMSRGSLPLNVKAVEALYRAGEACGVPRQLYISSYSAKPEAASEYARSKYLLENFFLERGQTVVRPGLVIGNGGMFYRNMQTVLRLPLVPLLDGGVDLLPVIGIGDFVRAVSEILERCPPGAYDLFHPELVSMRRLLEAVHAAAGRRPRFFSVSRRVAAAALDFFRRLRIPVPVNPDNVAALKQNQAVVHASSLPELLPAFASMEEAVREALRPAPRARR